MRIPRTVFCRWSLVAGAFCSTASALEKPAAEYEISTITAVQYKAVQPVSARQWDVVDIRFDVNDVPQQPEDVEFSASFEHESGRRLDVPGFFDGEGVYVIRYTPPLAGDWKYRTHSAVKELDQLDGQLIAGAARAGRRGGIKIDPESATRFRYENGDSYYPIAFESDWLFALDAENPDDIPVTRKFVDTLAANGFNQVVMNVFAYDVNWAKDERLDPKYEYGSPSVFPFGGSNTDSDHSRLNIDFFKRLDRVIDYLDQKGIAAHLMIYVWNKQVNWPPANSEADNRYFDYVVRRYQAFPNLVWDISKEALGHGHNDVNYITDRIERLRKLDRFHRLVTVHDYGYCRRFTRNVDFVSVQLWSSELHGVMRKVRAKMPDKPILNIEHGGYERGPYVVFTGNYTSPEVCLERAWQCVFAETYPTHYWQGAAWNVIIPDIEALKPEDRPRFEYYRHMRSFVDKYNLDQLIAGDKKSNAGFSLHNGKDLYIYYVPRECDFIGVRLPKELRGKMMTGTWFNPFAGTFSKPTVKEIVQWPSFAMPEDEGFRILIVEVKNSAGGSEFWGNWALEMPNGAAGWLTLKESDRKPQGELWTVGGGRQLSEMALDGDTLRFVRHVKVGDPPYEGGPPTGERVACKYTANVNGDAIRLVMHRPLADDTIEELPFTGKRMPPLPPKPDLNKVRLGEPIELFNGRNLEGWKLTNPKQINGWKAVDGELVNTTKKLDFSPYSRYGNLRTEREFMDFNLKIEFKVPPGGNSGIYLRGVYEAQVLDRDSKMQGIQGVGAIFGRIKPTENAGKLGGQWNSYDITLVDRHVTVILNGKKVIDNQPIAGCTNGALHAEETIPGPLFLQGDHTAVSYRNIVLRPVLASP